MAASPFKHFLVTFLMPEKCYERFFVNFHMNVACLKFVMNRVVGFWILLDTFLAQLPQLLKILWRRSADGLSLTSALLQLAWVERLITLTQTATIVFLILHYRGKTLTGILFLLAFGGSIFLLASYAAAAVVSAMQASSLAALIASKVFQAGTNYSNGSTGQLSTLSVLLSWAGSLGFIFVSLQETGNWLATLSHTLSACLSCVLLAQVLCCSPAAAKKKSD
ncbi:mannose-P-dolichol utilization defect 1 protein-like isoform X2 [Eleginops maclovinus]|uniref:mannose-P-dolichol utilization defect 1 protein-like isoform X2 n=1 Tax=Eleginops maclovinus TaxID=56733 RepID=UPI0030804C48